MSTLLRSALAFGAIAAACAAAFFAYLGLGAVAPGTVLRSRSGVFFLLAITALFVVLAGLYLAIRRGFRPVELAAGLGAAELVLAAAVAWVSGAGPGERFFWSWYAGLALLLAVPWLGAVVLARRRRAS